MTTRERLIRARDLIMKGWIQGELAMTDVSECDPNDPDACHWCTLGALNAVTERNAEYTDCINTIRKFIPSAYRDEIAVYNDLPTTTNDDILAVFDKAIEVAT